MNKSTFILVNLGHLHIQCIQKYIRHFHTMSSFFFSSLTDRNECALGEDRAYQKREE